MNAIRIFSLAGMLALGTLIAACSDSTGPDGTGTVRMQAKLAGSVVNAALLDTKGASPLGAGAEVDSLSISRVRILVTELKLHDKVDDDTTDDDSEDRLVKTGPIVIDADSTGVKVFLTEEIPAGDYDKVKFEFHRFNASQVAQYLGDTIFGPFVTDDRWSVIVDGTLYNGGQATPFTYRSDITANLSLKFPEEIEVPEGGTGVIVVEIDPIEIFKEGNGVLDPRDGSNESKIDNAIKSAIRALKG